MVDENQSPLPPPPPEVPPASATGVDDDYQEEGYQPQQFEQEPSVRDDAGPAVANMAGKNVVLILVGVSFAVFLIYKIFFAGDDEGPPPAPAPDVNVQGASVAPAQDIPITAQIFEPLPPPPPPPVLNTEEVLPLPPPPAPANTDMLFSGDAPSNEALDARRKSTMLILGGGGTGSDEEDQTNTEESAALRAVATDVGDLDSLILEGKIIHAVLETALDTTLQGPLRAIVSRDVYAESGYGVLIPKGSRLIGTYSTDIVRGQGRVFISWARVIRPDGIDVALQSQAIDSLGRSGIPGHVDNRYFEIFGGAILTSILTITVAGVADAILSPEDTATTISPDGGTTTTGSGVNTAITSSVETIGGAATNIASGLLDARPNITIDQGTPFKVFVNRDLEFPESLTRKVNVLQ